MVDVDGCHFIFSLTFQNAFLIYFKIVFKIPKRFIIFLFLIYFYFIIFKKILVTL